MVKRLILVLILLVFATPAVASIGEIKTMPEGEPVQTTDSVVTAVFPDYFYIEEQDRSAGIRVEMPDYSFIKGDMVTVQGTVGETPDGELCILATSATKTGSSDIRPLGMTNKALASGTDAWQWVWVQDPDNSITEYRSMYQQNGMIFKEVWKQCGGVNTTGLYVRTFGEVLSQNDNIAYIYDGSFLSNYDGTQYGMKVVLNGQTLAVGEHITVTGVASCEWDSTCPDGEENLLPVLLSRSESFGGPYTGEMIYIPAGSFLMGNNGNEPYSYDKEFPQHSVYLSGYWIGKYEVTRGEYKQFMEAGGYSNPAYWSTEGWNWKVSENRTEPRFWADEQNWGTGTFTQTDNHPVVDVTYYEAEAFCNWAGGHLPTEAQWEKAARWTGSHPNVYPWGDAWDAEKCNARYDTNPAGGGYNARQTAPVGSYPSGASPYGCQDMAGNVWEWCKDWHAEDYYSVSPSSDPQGPSSSPGGYRVLRGGSWSNYYASENNNRCAVRNAYYPNGNGIQGSYYGFRVAY